MNPLYATQQTASSFNQSKAGGAAFPSELMRVEGTGMSLRDYFAASALTGLLSNPYRCVGQSPSEIAELSYRMADAMLKEKRNG